MERDNKDYTVSFIRLTALVLLFSCHIFEVYGFTYNKGRSIGIFGNYCAVCVQLFLCISGFLYGRRKDLFKNYNRFHFVLKKFKKVLFDYYVYLLFFIYPIYYFLRQNEFNYSFIYKTLTISQTIYGIHHIWYIPYILSCYLITPYLFDLREYIRQKNLNKVLIFLLVFLGIILLDIFFKAYHVYFNSAWIACYVLAFFLNDFLNLFSKNKLKIIALFFLIVSSILNFYKYEVRYLILPNAQGDLKTFCNYYIDYSRSFFAISIFIVIWCLGKYYVKSDSSFVKLILDFSDKYSYDIYLVHMIFVKGFLTLVNKTHSLSLNIIMIVFVSIINAILLNKICNFLKWGAAKLYSKLYLRITTS